MNGLLISEAVFGLSAFAQVQGLEFEFPALVYQSWARLCPTAAPSLRAGPPVSPDGHVSGSLCLKYGDITHQSLATSYTCRRACACACMRMCIHPTCKNKQNPTNWYILFNFQNRHVIIKYLRIDVLKLNFSFLSLRHSFYIVIKN